MDHEDIRDRNLADLYLADELSAEEKAAFEEHFFDCQECLEELETARSFGQGMKDGAKLPATPARWWMLLAFAAGVVVTLALAALLKRTPDFPEQQQLAAERQKNSELQRELALAATPQTDIDIYPLNVARESGAVSQLRLPATRRTFVLMLDRQPDPAYRSYRAKLSDAASRVIWTREGIEPGARATFAIALPSDLFAAGDYFLDFEGDSASGFVRMARYRLHITSSAEK
jgi:Putative zinc-finger